MSNRSGFKDVDVLVDAEGVIAIISKRIHNGSYSFAIMREFERDDTKERTSFIPRKAADAAVRVTERAKVRIDELVELDKKAAAAGAM